ncbi:translation initiation factor IF-2-like [Cricetulus griseus]|uniref:Translation initiation factor IF-2-like n=1 Tax=Cricetulus griseus TaxID=10029 RepID=A0A9J7H388_CRIGR|nr:translation initiation factor IF-2-like [Cricetulus griseus]
MGSLVGGTGNWGRALGYPTDTPGELSLTPLRLSPDTVQRLRLLIPRPPQPRKAVRRVPPHRPGDRGSRGGAARARSLGESGAGSASPPGCGLRLRAVARCLPARGRRGRVCSPAREPGLRPAANHSCGRGDGAEGLDSGAPAGTRPPRTHPPRPARKASAAGARAPRSRRLRGPRPVPELRRPGSTLPGSDADGGGPCGRRARGCALSRGRSGGSRWPAGQREERGAFVRGEGVRGGGRRRETGGGRSASPRNPASPLRGRPGGPSGTRKQMRWK